MSANSQNYFCPLCSAVVASAGAPGTVQTCHACGNKMVPEHGVPRVPEIGAATPRNSIERQSAGWNIKAIIGVLFCILAAAYFVQGVLQALHPPDFTGRSILILSHLAAAFLPSLIALIVALFLLRPKKPK